MESLAIIVNDLNLKCLRGELRLPLFRVYKIKKSTKSYYLSSFEKNAQLLAETLTNICKLSEVTVIGKIHFQNYSPGAVAHCKSKITKINLWAAIFGRYIWTFSRCGRAALAAGETELDYYQRWMYKLPHMF